MKIEINEDGTVTIDGEKYAKLGYFQQQKTNLEKARERYPIGTRFKSVVNGNVCISDCEPFYYYQDCIAATTYRNDGGEVYVDGKWAEIVTEPLHHTIEEIYDSVKPEYWVSNSEEILDDIGYTDFNSDCVNVPTIEDAEYILATMQLINIANYYNAKYPEEERRWSFRYNDFKLNYLPVLHSEGQIAFSASAAKEALSNPNVIDVLNKYFKIK